MGSSTSLGAAISGLLHPPLNTGRQNEIDEKGRLEETFDKHEAAKLKPARSGRILAKYLPAKNNEFFASFNQRQQPTTTTTTKRPLSLPTPLNN